MGKRDGHTIRNREKPPTAEENEIWLLKEQKVSLAIEALYWRVIAECNAARLLGANIDIYVEDFFKDPLMFSDGNLTDDQLTRVYKAVVVRMGATEIDPVKLTSKPVIIVPGRVKR